MVVCQNRSGNDCRAPNVTDAFSFNANLVPPDAWFLNAPSLPIPDPAVHSWALRQPINFWSYQGNFPDEAGAFATPANMDVDDRSMFPGSTPTSLSQNHFTRVLSGYLALDGAATRTFAIATGEGYFFALGGTNAGTLTASEFPAAHRISYTAANALQATFPSTTQLYPFMLAYYENTGVSSAEFAWAAGTKAANNLPAFNGTVWSANDFSLVPGAQMYSPDVRATMSWSGVAAAGQTVTFHARVENAGPVPAAGSPEPPDIAPGACPQAQGLCFTLLLPVAAFDATTIAPGSVTVNGVAAPFTVRTNAANTNALVAVSLGSNGVDSVSPGSVVTVDVPVAIAAAPGATIRAQGRVTGHASDPAVFLGAVAPPYSLAVLTNDPTLSEPADSGNRPAGLRGFSPEAPLNANSIPVVLIPATLGVDDDDPTRITIGQPAAAPPAIATPTANSQISSVTSTTVSGSSTPPIAQNSIRVELTSSDAPGIGITSCNSFGGTWAWDPAGAGGAGVCACSVSSDAGGAWSCSSIALTDCAVPGALCYQAIATVADAAADAGLPPAVSNFGVKAPVATVNAHTLNSHVVVVDGTAADGVSGSAAEGATVRASLTGPNAFNGSCSAAVLSGTWQCLISVPADGVYAATAAVREASASFGPNSAPASYLIDTAPTLFAAPATTNLLRPSFSGHKVGDGNEIRVCEQSANCLLPANALCRVTAPVPANWSCSPAANLAARAFTVVSFEVDAAANLSAPSAAQTMVVNGTAPSLLTAPPGRLFNLATSTATVGGACAAGQTVTASLPTNPGPSTCSATCSPTGAWSCAFAFGPVNRAAGAPTISMTVTEIAADNSPKISPPQPGFLVDTVPPVAAKMVVAPLLVGGSAATNPPAVGCTGACGANEIGGTVAVTVVGTARDTGAQLAARCAVQNILISATGTWSCSAWTGTAVPAGKFVDGDYVLSATQSDASGNPQPVPSTVNFSVKTRPPGSPFVSVPTDGGFTKDPKPVLQITATEGGGSVVVSVRNQANAIVASCGPQPVSAAASASCTVATSLDDGTYTLSAIHTDAAGNISAPGISTLHVKTRTATPVFVSSLVGGNLADPIRLDGTAEAGATVVVKIDDDPALASVTADTSGHFSVSAGVVSTGSHFAQAVATDFLGNTAQSTRIQFSVNLGGQVAGSSFGCSSSGGSGSFLLLLGIVPLLARRRKGVALAAAVVASAGVARADGTDLGLDSFRPASGSDGTIGVEGARPLRDGEASWEARGLLVGQSKPLVFVPDGGGQSQALIRSRVGGWLTGQAHVVGPLSLGLQLPFLVQQSGDLTPLPSNVSGGAVLGGGLGDLRATARLGILRQERAGFDLAFQASADLPTAKKQSFLGDSAVQGEGLAAVGYRVAFSSRSAVDLLGNAFFRMRPSRDILEVKTGSEIGLRGALAWLPGGGPLAPQRVVLEMEGASFLRGGLAAGSVPAEWRGGVSYCAGPVTFDFGIGGALAAGVGTPGLRIIGGVGYAPSVCNPNARAAPMRPLSPIRVVDAAPAAPSPPSPPASTTKIDEKPAAIASAAPTAPAKTRGTEVTILPLPELPPLPPAKTQKKRTVAQADPLPAMPDLPSVTALPLPAAAPRAALSGDRLELARPVAFRGSRLPAKEAMLDEVARLLSAHPEIEVVGISAPDDARTKAVIAYLRKRGVAASRLRPEGRADPVELRILRRR